jgi:hypothetical protein
MEFQSASLCLSSLSLHFGDVLNFGFIAYLSTFRKWLEQRPASKLTKLDRFSWLFDPTPGRIGSFFGLYREFATDQFDSRLAIRAPVGSLVCRALVGPVNH